MLLHHVKRTRYFQTAIGRKKNNKTPMKIPIEILRACKKPSVRNDQLTKRYIYFKYMLRGYPIDVVQVIENNLIQGERNDERSSVCTQRSAS